MPRTNSPNTALLCTAEKFKWNSPNTASARWWKSKQIHSGEKPKKCTVEKIQINAAKYTNSTNTKYCFCTLVESQKKCTLEKSQINASSHQLAKYCFCTLEKSKKMHSREKQQIAKTTSRKGTQLCCAAVALLYKSKTFFTNRAASKIIKAKLFTNCAASKKRFFVCKCTTVAFYGFQPKPL